MRVLIACVSASSTPDGVTRHAVNLAASLAQSPDVEEVHLAIGSWQLPFFQTLLGEDTARCRVVLANCSNSSLKRNLWYLRDLPSLAHESHADLIHLAYPAPIGPMHTLRSSCAVITTLHDLYPIDAPHNFGYPRVLLNRFILNLCLPAADAIACVSSSTLARLKTHHPLCAAKASLIPNSFRPTRSSSAAPDLRLEHRPFLLAVAQHRRNKNLPLTLQAFRHLLHTHPDLLLVIVGNNGPETAALHRILEDKLLRSRVLLLHGLSDQHLQWCYLHCKLLLATSTVEGFGLPIAEAMRAGCPIVCSDIAAFREFGDPYCHFVPLGTNAASTFAASMQHTLTQPRPAPHSLPQLNARNVVDQCLRLYRTVLANRPLNHESLALQPHKDPNL